MKSMLTIIKKELRRYYTDKRLLAALILPGIAIFFIYTLLGTFMNDFFEIDEETEFTVHVLNQDEAMDKFFIIEGLPTFHFTIITEDEIESSKELVKSKEIDIVVVYDDNFNELLNNGNHTDFGYVDIYYNNDSMDSSMAYSYFNALITEINKSIVTPPIRVNDDQNTVYDLVDSDTTSSILLMMLPMLLLMFLVTGVMSVAVEAIAGEKERGTVASLLITPISRFNLAFAKIIAIAIPAIMSAFISFFGLVLSLPKMFESSGLNMGIGSIKFTDGLMLFIVTILTVILFTVIISIISTFAKSVKEAQQLTSPLLILVTICGVVTAFIPSNIWVYFIPVINTSLTLTGVLGGSYEFSYFIITILSNLVLIVLGVFLIGKMFNKESIIFNK